MSLRGYQNYERGERAIPVALVRALYEEFRVDLVWLLTGEGSMLLSGAALPQRHHGEQSRDDPRRRNKRGTQAADKEPAPAPKPRARKPAARR